MTPEIGQVNRVQTSAYQRLTRLLVPIGLAVMLFGLLVWPGLANTFGQKFRLSTLLSVVSANPDIAAGGDYTASVWSEGYNQLVGTKDWGRVYIKSANVISGWEARIPVSTGINDDVWGREPRLVFDPTDPTSTTVHVVWAQATGCSNVLDGTNPQCNWSSIQYTSCDLGDTEPCASPETVAAGLNDASTPDVAVDSSGDVHVVWRANASPNLGYAKRLGSSTWVIDTVETVSGKDEQNPALAFLDGNLHLVWDEEDEVIDPTTSRIQYRRDPNPGNNLWDHDLSSSWIAQSGLGNQDPGFPAIGVGESNAIYLVWAVKKTNSVPLQYALAFDFSNNGASWQDAGGDGLSIPGKNNAFAPYNSAKSAGRSYLESLKPDVAVTGTGDSAYAHVVWHGSIGEGSVYDVWYSYLEGIGAPAWTSPVNLTNSSGDSADPAIGAVDTVSPTHVVFMEDANASNSEVWYTGSNTGRENDENKTEGNIYLPIVFK